MAKRVMIVEDNELNMKLFKDLIEASGYETIRTRNGLEALDLAGRIILTDPNGHSAARGFGLEVTKWIKEDDKLHRIPVIAVTAFAMKGDEERIRRGAVRPIYPSQSRSPNSSNHQVLFGRCLSGNGGLCLDRENLVVDDIAANVKLLQARLSAEYYEVATAFNGPDALTICAKGGIDLVLLDIMMPGMDGFEVCMRLKAEAATQHITGSHGDSTRPTCRPASRLDCWCR